MSFTCEIHCCINGDDDKTWRRRIGSIFCYVFAEYCDDSRVKIRLNGSGRRVKLRRNVKIRNFWLEPSN